MKQESVDRLSPLTSNVTQFGTTSVELEKFTADIDVDSSVLPHQSQPVNDPMHLYPNNANSCNVRRHTVGPGDVVHEQALGNNPAIPINFKFVGAGEQVVGPNTHIPINIPMLENQPLNTFTIKDQHLLKPPTVMGASKIFS